MTKRVTLQPGDLVCYNVGGAKETSLAHVVEVRHPKRWSVGDALMDMEERTGSIFVLWIKDGSLRPPHLGLSSKAGKGGKAPL